MIALTDFITQEFKSIVNYDNVNSIDTSFDKKTKVTVKNSVIITNHVFLLTTQ